MSVQPFRPDDFVPKRVLGRGAFGVVALAEKRPRSARTGERRPASNPKVEHAIKVIDKAQLVGERAVALARLERDVLDALAHKRCPFVAKLRFAFHTGQEKGDSTSLQRGFSRSDSQEESIHALSSPREMIARPKMSQIEWKTIEI